MKAETLFQSCQGFSYSSNVYNNDVSLSSEVFSCKSSSKAKAPFSSSFLKTSKLSNSFGALVIGSTKSPLPDSIDESLDFVFSISIKAAKPSHLAASLAAITTEYARKALVDSRAPFSAIDETEWFAYLLCLVAGDLALKNIFDEANQCGCWQYGNGSCASERRKVLELATFRLQTDQCTAALIRRLVVEGSFR